ncbi:hypothetical protein [Jannaschia sp. M317]|uniref:hypothetical protein n=1 Tax=Jannaschia sp. M317 TaxID=2867011 RepID=UPI0021A40B6F|nr:hypothetical protein [Jannaschia sp. M317]UWQ16119.1 hypothetical protein K3551_09200 [Jannaschia sp. M317]
MYRTFALPALALVTLLSACNGGSDFERAAVGAVIGCAVGEIVDDGKCVTGAAIGAAGGALANDI